MRDVHVIGVGVTPFGKYLDRSLPSLAHEATAAALADAKARAEDVASVFFANAAAGLITGQEMIRGQAALRETGLLGRPVVNVENACASGSTAFNLGWLSVASGQADIVLVVGAEKLAHHDKQRSFAAFVAAADQEVLRGGDSDLVDPDLERAASQSIFMDVYARLASRYMEHSGATAEDLAAVAVKAHDHGALNPLAQYRDRLTVEQVLGSRSVSGPLTLLMCSPVGDGAAALVLASEEGAARLGAADPVTVLATVVLTAEPVRRWEEPSVVAIAAQQAYEFAGIGPRDVDVIELHDAAAPAELAVPEDLGLCPRDGGGLELLRSGATRIGGRIPINPSGGLLSKGHPIGATGCAQIAELVEQLRGRCGARQVDARIGLAENGGGWIGSSLGDPAVATVTILARANELGRNR
jgi:acetyl-CoA acyltransferase